MPATIAQHTDTFEEFARPLVESGRFPDTGAVLHAAMDALMREECDEAAKERYVRQAIEDGEASGIFRGDAFASVRREMGWESVA